MQLVNKFRSIINYFPQNDDEAERVQRRRTLGKSPAASVILSDERLDEEQQGFDKCLKIYHDNVSIHKRNLVFSISFFFGLFIYAICYLLYCAENKQRQCVAAYNDR